MEGGLFLLLCLLALFIGSRARRSQLNVSKKALKQKAKIKRLMMITALVLVTAVLLFYIPFLYQEIDIALHTRFEMNTYLGIGIVFMGSFVIYTIIKKLRSPLEF